jgi:inorganic phosphate transporter, PiT family
MELAVVVALVAAAPALDVTNGFHDAANAIATSVSTSGAYAGGRRIIRILGRGSCAPTHRGGGGRCARRDRARLRGPGPHLAHHHRGGAGRGSRAAVRCGVAGDIVVAWILTIPGAGVVAAGSYLPPRPLVPA